MKENYYRVWNKTTKTMQYFGKLMVCYDVNNTNHGLSTEFNEALEVWKDTCKNTVQMQDVGVASKENKRLYGGDVVKFMEEIYTISFEKGCYFLIPVVPFHFSFDKNMKNSASGIKQPICNFADDHGGSSLRLLGNIYENHNLIIPK